MAGRLRILADELVPAQARLQTSYGASSSACACARTKYEVSTSSYKYKLQTSLRRTVAASGHTSYVVCLANLYYIMVRGLFFFFIKTLAGPISA